MNAFEFENNSETRLNIQMTWPDQDISQINPESRINRESRVNPESRFNPDIQINLDSRINCPIQINSPIWPSFNIPLTRPMENSPPTWPTENNHQNIQMTQPDQDIIRVNPESRINPKSRFNPDSRINIESRINSLIRINSLTRPTFNIPFTRSAGRRILRQRDNFYVEYKFYVYPNLQASREIISRQR